MNLKYIMLAALVAAYPIASAVAQTPAADTHSAANNPNQPGATGSTVVTGDSSTPTEDKKATMEQKSGETGSR